MSALQQSKPRAQAAQAVYKRPAKLAAPQIPNTRAYRFAVLRQVFAEADEGLEAAYDLAEPDSAVEVLLDHAAHNLLVDVMCPGLYRTDGAQSSPTIGDLANAHTSLVTVLAALEGVMALSIGSPFSTRLENAFQLLEWACGECEELSGFRLVRSATGEALQ